MVPRNCSISKTGHNAHRHKDPEIRRDQAGEERGLFTREDAPALSSPADSTKQVSVRCTCWPAFSSASQECLQIDKYIRTHSKPGTPTFPSELEQVPHEKRINLGISSMRWWRHMIYYGSFAYNFFHWNHIAHNSRNILFNNAGRTS